MHFLLQRAPPRQQPTEKVLAWIKKRPLKLFYVKSESDVPFPLDCLPVTLENIYLGKIKGQAPSLLKPKKLLLHIESDYSAICSFDTSQLKILTLGNHFNQERKKEEMVVTLLNVLEKLLSRSPKLTCLLIRVFPQGLPPHSELYSILVKHARRLKLFLLGWCEQQELPMELVEIMLLNKLPCLNTVQWINQKKSIKTFTKTKGIWLKPDGQKLELDVEKTGYDLTQENDFSNYNDYIHYFSFCC